MHPTGALLGIGSQVLSVRAQGFVPGVAPNRLWASRKFSPSLARCSRRFPLPGRRSGPRASSSGVSQAGPASLPNPLWSTWLRGAILGSQEAPSQGKAEPRPEGGAEGRTGSEGRALGGGRGGPCAEEAATSLGAPESRLGPSRRAKAAPSRDAPPPTPVTPGGRCSRSRSHPHPASRFPGANLRRRSPLCQTLSTLCKDKEP